MASNLPPPQPTLTLDALQKGMWAEILELRKERDELKKRLKEAVRTNGQSEW